MKPILSIPVILAHVNLERSRGAYQLIIRLAGGGANHHRRYPGISERAGGGFAYPRATPHDLADAKRAARSVAKQLRMGTRLGMVRLPATEDEMDAQDVAESARRIKAEGHKATPFRPKQKRGGK